MADVLVGPAQPPPRTPTTSSPCAQMQKGSWDLPTSAQDPDLHVWLPGHIDALI